MDDQKTNVEVDIDNLYYDYFEIHCQMMAKYPPLAVAAVLMAQSLSIYKTVLSESDYDQMVDSVSDSRSKVKEMSFDPNGYIH